MLGFFATELVLHAIAQVNADANDSGATLENEVRELRQIIVLAPTSLNSQERAALLDRIADVMTRERLVTAEKGTKDRTGELWLVLGASLGDQLPSVSFADLSDATRTAVQASETRLKGIIETSHVALRNLQFQDAMAQGLRKIEGEIEEARPPMLAALGVVIDAPIRAPGAARSASQRAISAGELELF